MEKVKNFFNKIGELFKKFWEIVKAKKVLFIIIASVLVLAIIATTVFIAFRNKNSGGNDDFDRPQGNTLYTLSVKTAGGMAMSGLDVYVYTDDSLSDMIDYTKTNDDGKATFNLDESADYAIVLTPVPKGYAVEESYKFDGTSKEIVLTSSLITDEDISTATLGLGDVMYDFTVMKPDGTEIKLSEVLKSKKLVVLNFWYTTCSWCLEEFPLMDEIYKDYKDDVEIIALNPMEDNNAVDGFQKQYGYTFPMASCPSSWANTFGVQGYPTSVFIDQYGLICVLESGAITSKRPWVCAFDHFTADPYEQKLCTNGIGDLVTQIKPTYEMPKSEDIAAAINSGNINVTYRAETEDENAEFIWPFILGDKSGRSCIYASNTGIDSSYAILYADVELKAGQAIGFDYLVSSELGCDIMYVIVNDEDIFQISGVSSPETWKSCYPCVADKDGTYELALCFMKDEDGSDGDDTVYIDNMRVVEQSQIDTATYLPRYAATADEDDNFIYVDVVYNKNDGYYHVGSENGPLLLADLMGFTPFNEEESVQTIVTNGDADKGKVSLYDKVEEGGLGMVQYFSYASNSKINGVCTVNKELADMLKQVADVAGFEDNENEWLKMCKYYQAYGNGASQLEDPIKGLATFSALTVTVGKNVPSNNFYYDRAIIPRGMFAKFVPTQSGVYRFTSKSDYQDGIDAWIFDKSGKIIYTYEHDERMYTDSNNCSMVYYMESGTPYYINMAFWDVYATGTINYDVEFIGASHKLFRLAAPGYFTYDTDATGSAMYDIITGGIKPILKDGKYYDSDDGSLIYADFTGLTTVFSNSITQMIEMGGFDFSKSETDGEIISYLKQNGNDVEKTKEYLKKLWGEDYDSNAEIYQLDDIFAGRYHGDGEDCTEDIKKYLSKIDKSGTELDGCVVVDEELAELLQQLMDKYTFEEVENSWLKICYYYDYLGAND
ncbi:MAG: redoxin domain-containing protein [Ruminococcaceae bacterium]|nr:redoxin domain-containing protein [Oscillospiraceae bacterium]